MQNATKRLVKCKYCDWTTPVRRGCNNKLEMHFTCKHPKEAEQLIDAQLDHAILDEMDDQAQEHQLISYS